MKIHFQIATYLLDRALCVLARYEHSAILRMVYGNADCQDNGSRLRCQGLMRASTKNSASVTFSRRLTIHTTPGVRLTG